MSDARLLKMMFREISDIPPFTKEEEQSIFKEYSANPTKEIRDEIVKRNLRLVYMVVRRKFSGRLSSTKGIISFADLVSVGAYRLLKLVDTFDVTKGWRFSSLAYQSIYYECHNHMIAHKHSIHIPRHISDQVAQWQCGKLEDDEVDPNVIDASNISVSSGDAPYSEDCDDSVLDILNVEEFTLDDNISDESVEDCVGIILDNHTRLDDREKKIIKLRFGIDAVESMTLESIGSILGLTKERVRQIEAVAIRKLRVDKALSDCHRELRC